MIDRLRELADRPIADRDRRRLFLACAAALLGAAALLLLAGGPGPGSPPSSTTSAGRPAPAIPPRSARPTRSARDSTRRATWTARRFLRGYLAFLYGQGAARAIDEASPHLLGRLARSRVRVPPAARRRRPQAVELRARRLGAGRVAVTATIDDGGVSRYPIELTLARRLGRWLVAAVGAD